MTNLTISPNYLMGLINRVESALWAMFENNKYRNVRFYIDKWHDYDINWENFQIFDKEDGNIDLPQTLHNIDGETLLKIAIDLGVDTPDFIPSIPTFRNAIKSDYPTASATFEKAFRQIEEHPDIAVGLANSALESIIKEVLKDDSIQTNLNSNKTLYDLTSSLLKEFALFPNSDMPQEIRTIGSALLSINQSIEKLRSEKTNLHGKTEADYIIRDSLYTYFVVNSVTTIGLFLKSFYETKFKPIRTTKSPLVDDDLPF